MNRRNAIILAAGKSSRFAPFTYERPKGLFRVKGEYLIERQIKQMIEANIEDIYVVVGYMKEKFFFLEQKYTNVHLLINNKFGVKGNLYSLYVAKEYLKNTYLSYADYYFDGNPFIEENTDNISYHVCIYRPRKFNEFSVDYSDANVITHVDLGGHNKMSMTGYAYFNEGFSHRLVELMDKEINDFRVNSLFWEEYFERHIKDLTLYMKPFKEDDIFEFNTIDDLRQFDSDFLYNVDSEIISNICETLKCNPNSISDINVINAGLTNVSFRFKVDGIEYVYRHPGGNAGNLIDRTAEMYSQTKAKELDIDKSFITMTLTGWKLSYCVQNLVECDFRKNPIQMKKGMDYLRLLHAIPVDEKNGVKNFDNVKETLRLMRIASLTKGNLMAEFANEIEKVKRLDSYLKEDLKRIGGHRCYCHNDIYEPNFLATKDGILYLIDWEYAGLNDPANDICGFFSRYDYTDAEIDSFIRQYLGKDYSEAHYRHCWAFIPVSAFYWMGWGFYKGSVGDDDGFFFLTAYRNFHRFIDKALSMFEN
ncbi:MAG: NTP transferase domain-containing protein [Prevotella sp.]|nr:NTP transferase domain-containing protein [Prevotella sp.]